VDFGDFNRRQPVEDISGFHAGSFAPALSGRKVHPVYRLRLIESDMMRMDLVLRYGPSLERELERILKQLERCQRMRLGQPLPPSIDVNHIDVFPLKINSSSGGVRS